MSKNHCRFQKTIKNDKKFTKIQELQRMEFIIAKSWKLNSFYEYQTITTKNKKNAKNRMKLLQKI